MRVPLQAQGASMWRSSPSSWHILHSTTAPLPTSWLSFLPSELGFLSSRHPANTVPTSAGGRATRSEQPKLPSTPSFAESMHASEAMSLSIRTIESPAMTPLLLSLRRSFSCSVTVRRTEGQKRRGFYCIRRKEDMLLVLLDDNTLKEIHNFHEPISN